MTADGRSLPTIVAAAGDGRLKEEWRLVQSLRNHAPTLAAPGLQIASDGEEYTTQDGHPADGLGVAQASRQLAVSLAGPAWLSHEVTILKLWLDQSTELQTMSVVVNHAASPEHVAMHTKLIRGLALSESYAGADIWSDRSGLFPDLEFLPPVAGQLSGLTGGAVSQVAARLSELQSVAANWPSFHGSAAWQAQIQSQVTTESASRRSVCMFRDLDGVDRCFDWHIRYTPVEGRIHFRLPADPTDKFVVAYVGKKIRPAKK